MGGVILPIPKVIDHIKPCKNNLRCVVDRIKITKYSIHFYFKKYSISLGWDNFWHWRPRGHKTSQNDWMLVWLCFVLEKFTYDRREILLCMMLKSGLNEG